MSPQTRTGSSSYYRWYILALSAITFTFAVAMPMMSMPVLFREIAGDLDLGLVQIGMAWGMVPFAGIFVVLAGGLLSDRFGIKRVLYVACFLGGIAGALRGFTGSFSTLAGTLFLFGLISAMIPPVVHKACGVWFSDRHLGLANGIVSTGMAVGFTLGSLISATLLSPLLGGWRNVLFLYGSISILVSILWFFSRDERELAGGSGNPAASIPFGQALSRVVRIKEVWILGFILLGQLGCVQGVLGYLPLHLRAAGWSGKRADGALALFHASSTLGVAPMALLSDRLHSRISILFAATVMTVVGVALISASNGFLVWVAVITAGVVRDGFMAVLMTTIIETDRIGPDYAGTAIGFILTLARLIAFISPPLGNSLVNISPRLPFIFWASLAALALVGFIYLKTEKDQ